MIGDKVTDKERIAYIQMTDVFDDNKLLIGKVYRMPDNRYYAFVYKRKTDLFFLVQRCYKSSHAIDRIKSVSDVTNG